MIGMRPSVTDLSIQSIQPLILAAMLVATPAVASAQTRAARVAPAPTLAPGAVPADQAAAIADAWAALAQGQIARAEQASARLSAADPRSPAVIALAVEVALAKQGWRGGLDVYDRWVDTRSVEDFYVLRRVARAVLYDALSSLPPAPLRLDVVDALERDGDADVAAYLRASTPRDAVDARALAAAGDAKSVAAITAGFPNDPRPVDSIDALGHSRSTTAVAPLVTMLNDSRSAVRAAAARALGELDAKTAMPQLRNLLNDRELLPRMTAAGSLMRMGDTSPSTLVSGWFNSNVGDIRLKAAEITAFNPDASWVAQVRPLLQDPDPMVRIGAARLISRQDPAAAKWAMQALTNDENLAIREEAQRVLPETIGGDFAQLRGFLRASDAETRVRAALQIVDMTR
jgi:HEAT repeat protein